MLERFLSDGAFGRCPNRTTLATETGNMLLHVCPKIPQGREIRATQISVDTARKDLALELGCMSCAYGKESYARRDTERILPDGTFETVIEFFPKAAYEAVNIANPQDTRSAE